MPEQMCRYVVISVPEGCTDLTPGEVFYEPAQHGQCPAMVISDGPCAGAYIEGGPPT